MIRFRGSRGVVTCLVVAALCAATPTLAGQAHGAVAELRAGGASLDWNPLVERQSMKLTVSGPGGLFLAREFGASESPSLSIFDKAGQRLPNGAYTWELRVSPVISGALKAELAAA